MIVKVTCKKCKSTNINITWKYAKKNELVMLLSHDGYGLQFEVAKMNCAKCGCDDLINLRYNTLGKLIKGADK